MRGRWFLFAEKIRVSAWGLKSWSRLGHDKLDCSGMSRLSLKAGLGCLMSGVCGGGHRASGAILNSYEKDPYTNGSHGCFPYTNKKWYSETILIRIPKLSVCE